MHITSWLQILAPSLMARVASLYHPSNHSDLSTLSPSLPSARSFKSSTLRLIIRILYSPFNRSNLLTLRSIIWIFLLSSRLPSLDHSNFSTFRSIALRSIIQISIPSARSFEPFCHRLYCPPLDCLNFPTLCSIAISTIIQIFLPSVWSFESLYHPLDYSNLLSPARLFSLRLVDRHRLSPAQYLNRLSSARLIELCSPARLPSLRSSILIVFLLLDYSNRPPSTRIFESFFPHLIIRILPLPLD